MRLVPLTFLHFFDVHFLELKSASRNKLQVQREARLATRFALLLSEVVLVPAASYFESEYCGQVVRELWQAYSSGRIMLVSGGYSIDEFIEAKLRQYPPGTMQHARYKKARLNGLPALKTKQGSSTGEIETKWSERLVSGPPIEDLFKNTGVAVPGKIETLWHEVPERLQGQAFIVPNVVPLLLNGKEANSSLRNRMHTLINSAYFEGYTKELSASIVKDLIFLESHLKGSGKLDLPFRALQDACAARDLLRAIDQSSYDELMTVGDNFIWHTAVEEALKRDHQTKLYQLSLHMKTTKSFIVHGHNALLRMELKDYIQNVLGMPEPVVLMEKPSGGNTIIEKFESYSKECELAFILLTSDDIAGKPGDIDLVKRARQNVIFELGYFVGKFGRNSGRVILLAQSGLEFPSDLAGVVYINIDNGIQSAGEQIRSELSNIAF